MSELDPNDPASAKIMQARSDDAESERDFYKAACVRTNHEIEQILGKALGYPWFCHDPKNFPGATEKDGVCVGEHTEVSLADEAADRIKALEKERDTLKLAVQLCREALPASGAKPMGEQESKMLRGLVELGRDTLKGQGGEL